MGKRAQLCKEYLKKGRKVGVTGKLQTYNYTGQDGQKKYGFEILLDELTFLSSSAESKPGEENSQATNTPPVQSAPPAASNDGFVEVDEEELPF